jgi:hypothetical protein
MMNKISLFAQYRIIIIIIVIMFYYYYTRIPQRVVTLGVRNLYVQLEIVQLRKQGHIFYICNHRLDLMVVRKAQSQDHRTFLTYTLHLLYTNARRLLENMASTRIGERQQQTRLLVIMTGVHRIKDNRNHYI